MLKETIEYLKDPHLVAKFQEFFGIRIHYHNDPNCRRHATTPNTHGSNDKSKVANAIHQDDRINHEISRKSKLSSSQSANHSSEERKNGITNNETPRIQGDDINGNKNQNSDNTNNTAFVKSNDGSLSYTITNRFWYYFFLLGTQLGDELFYSTFFPFWFWNVDGAVGRRIILVWAIVMIVGQTLKDVIRWPRPSCPPAVRLQDKWSQEYGMPSTHAMVGVSIPFSVILFTMNRYIYPFPIGCTIAVIWCFLVCTSRLYLGMHTVLDVVAGLMLAILLMIPLVPVIDVTDYYFLTKGWALTLLIVVSIATIYYYPSGSRWTPTRGDTTMVVSLAAGIHVGAMLNYKTGAGSVSPILSPPYNIIWPSYSMFGRLMLRTTIGFCCVLATKAICKSLSYATMCAILKVNSKELMASENSLNNRNKILVDLVYKYIACFLIGLNTTYFLPNVFTIIGIERPTFYTEF